MKLGMVIAVKNEESILARHLLYHLNRQGVDKILVYDNGSYDNTLRTVKELNEPRIRIKISKANVGYRQDIMYTEGAQLLFNEDDCDWVVPTDADEFWVSKNHHTMKRAIEVISDKGNLFAGYALHFRETDFDSPDEPDFLRRLTYCIPSTNMRVILHRSSLPTNTLITFGGHRCFDTKQKVMVEGKPLEFHDLVRYHYNHISEADTIRRILNQVEGFIALKGKNWLAGHEDIGSHVLKLYNMIKQGTFQTHYRNNIFLSRPIVEKRLAAGNLIRLDYMQTVLDEL